MILSSDTHSDGTTQFRFHYRVLTGYGGNPEQDLNSVRNEVALRADLSAQGFDQGLFVFVPYAEHVVAVFVRNLAQDLAHEYHLRAIDFPTRIRRGYLFIRFAWNIFKFLTPGLADAAVVIRPLKERPDGGGFLKRTHADTTSGGSKKPKTGGTKQEDVGGADNTPITEDEDEAQLVVFDKLDASLKGAYNPYAYLRDS
jgi:hypothetical protein